MRILMITMSLFSILGCTHAQTQSERLALEKVAEGVYVHHGQHLDIDTGYQGDICSRCASRVAIGSAWAYRSAATSSA